MKRELFGDGFKKDSKIKGLQDIVAVDNLSTRRWGTGRIQAERKTELQNKTLIIEERQHTSDLRR